MKAFVTSGVFEDPANYQSFIGLLMIYMFAVASFWIEIIASIPSVNRKFVRIDSSNNMF